MAETSASGATVLLPAASENLNASKNIQLNTSPFGKASFRTLCILIITLTTYKCLI
jgi:hypothetical protein